MDELHIIPEPKSVKYTGQTLKLKKAVTRKLITELENSMRRFPKYIERALNAFGVKTRFFEVDNLEDQAYKIEIGEKGIVIYACNRTGLKYGFYTLLQVLESCQKSISCCVIEDEPAGAFRAFHLDLRVHKYKPRYLKYVFRNLARMKYRYALLEYEDTFPYSREACITGEKYFTSEQLNDLLRTARRYGINIIPYVPVYSKLNYVLELEQYSSLAVKAGTDEPRPAMPVLDVSDPRTRRLACRMIDELKEKHECPYIFIDLSTYDVCGTPAEAGTPRSPAFIEFAQYLVSRAARKNSIPVIWADLLLDAPEIIPSLPETTVVVVRETPVRKKREATLKLCRDYGITAVNEISCLNNPDAEFSRDTSRMLDNISQATKLSSSDGTLVTSYTTTGQCCNFGSNGIPVSMMSGIRRMHMETTWYAVSAAAEAAWNPKAATEERFVDKWPRFWFGTQDKRLMEIQQLQALPLTPETDFSNIIRDRKRVVKLSEEIKPAKRAKQIAVLDLYARLAMHAVHVVKTFARSPKKQQLALLKSEITRMKDKHKAVMQDSLYSREIGEEQKYLFGHTEMLISRLERELT
jgi:hypothetical protein